MLFIVVLHQIYIIILGFFKYYNTIFSNIRTYRSDLGIRYSGALYLNFIISTYLSGDVTMDTDAEGASRYHVFA